MSLCFTLPFLFLCLVTLIAACDKDDKVVKEETVHHEVVVEDSNKAQPPAKDPNVGVPVAPANPNVPAQDANTKPPGSSALEKVDTAIKLAAPHNPNHTTAPKHHTR